jgi:hypothetical protein
MSKSEPVAVLGGANISHPLAADLSLGESLGKCLSSLTCYQKRSG